MSLKTTKTLTGINIIEQRVEHGRCDADDVDVTLPGLGQPAREHGLEVRTGRTQHGAVRQPVTRTNAQPHVTQLPAQLLSTQTLQQRSLVAGTREVNAFRR